MTFVLRGAAIPWVWVAFVALCGGCQKADTATPISNNSVESPSLFQIQTQDVALTVGTRGIASVVLQPKAPWKYNDAYPTQLSLQALQGQAAVSLENQKYGKKEVRLSAGNAAINVPLQGVRAGEEAMKGTLKFSLCREEKCVLREKEVLWNIRVTESSR